MKNNNWLEKILKKPHFIISLLGLFIFLGVYGYKQIDRKLFPDSNRPEIAVVIVWQGAGAKDIASKFFDKTKSQAGSALTVAMEGTRALILEVQALVTESTYPNPKRSATGFDLNRLTMLLALLEKKLDLPLNHYDVYVNISGGIKIKESSADLAVIAAIISSFRDRPISKESAFIGEVSLTGEIKDVYSMDMRLKEASAQGITKAIIAKKPSIKVNTKCFAVDEVHKMIELF